MKKYNFLILFSLMLFGSTLFAQPTGDGGVSDEVQILSSFNAKLQSSNKLRTTPTINKDGSNVNDNLIYKLPTRLLTLNYEAPVIRPLTMAREKLAESFNFYGKVGYGTPNSPFVDLRYNAGKGDKLDYGIKAKHHSANNNSNVANQRFSNTDIGLNGTYYAGILGIGGNIGYELDDYYLYGVNPSDTMPLVNDTLRQRFGTFKIGAELFNSESNMTGLDYKGDLDFYRMGDAYDGAETGILFQADVTKYFSDKHPLNVKLYNDYNRYNQDTANVNNNILGINPSFTYHTDAFKVKIGANLGQEAAFFVFPDVEASYNLAGGKFSIVAGWTGEVVKNSYYSTTGYNPYIFAPTGLLNTQIQRQFAGVNVKLTGLEITGSIARKPTKNLQMFVNDTTEGRFFHTRYDDANIFNVHAEAIITLIKNLEIGGTLDLNTFTMTNEAKAWHLPNFESNIYAKFKMLEDKLTLKGELYLANSIAYIDETGTEQVLAGVFDLSLGATYDVTKNFGVFLDLNNITAQQYVRWYRYPNFGFNLLVGVKARF